MDINHVSNQFRWVILLLATVVILPSVCLLWFMNQAVKNERLVVRQKLIDLYQEKTAPLLEHLEQSRLDFERKVKQMDESQPHSFFLDQCIEQEHAGGLLIYDASGQVLFPLPEPNNLAVASDALDEVWPLEFIDRNYLEAAQAYERISESSAFIVAYQARLAMIRCYQKAHDFEQAIAICRKLVQTSYQTTSPDKILARLKLIQLYHEHDFAQFKREAPQFLSDLIDNSVPALPSSVRVFVLNELLALIHQTPIASAQITRAIKIRNAENLSLCVYERLIQQPRWSEWPEKQLQTLDLDEPVYAMRFVVDESNVIFLSKRESIVNVMTSLAQRLSDETVEVGVFDPQDIAAFGSHQRSTDAFLTLRPSRYLDRWKLCFFFRNDGVFDSAAQKHTNIYIWAGILSTGLVLAAGAMTARMINAQIKMNHLKNDFLATVTHELKTPLASTRLLVDTILAGNCQDRQEEKEFLHLIAQENERLSRLIDNFLCFSRMERRKQAFDPKPTHPIDMVKAATETVSAGYQEKGCQLTVTCDENLPLIQVDADAWVRALVNLLENACKYSQAPRDVHLKVYEHGQSVCFAVRDHGIGMNTRQVKRAFDKFYQADPSLARRHAGCGLGLSIVKFIVDSHQGDIQIQSQPGQGTTVTIECPKTTNCDL